MNKNESNNNNVGSEDDGIVVDVWLAGGRRRWLCVATASTDIRARKSRQTNEAHAFEYEFQSLQCCRNGTER